MRVGVVGIGRIGALHARTLAGSRLASSVLLHDIDAIAADRVAREVGGVHCSSADEVVAESDAIVVATPAAARMSVLGAAIDKGIPVFCEKPLASNLADARVLAEWADKRSTPVQIGFQRRFDPGYRMLRQLVVSGAIGQVLMVRGTAFDRRPPSAGYESTAGDIFTDCLIHDIDAVRWITGDEVVAVQADQGELAATGDDPAVGIATVVLTLAGGGRAVLTASRLDPRGYDHRMEVLGTRDSVATGLTGGTPLRPLRVTRELDDRADTRFDFGESAFTDFTDRFATAYHEEIRAFLRMAVDGGPSPCGPSDAVCAQEIAAAAGASAHGNTRFRIESRDDATDPSHA